MSNNKIKFTFLSEYAWGIQAARPRPMSSSIPKWFKDMDQYLDSSELRVRNRDSNATAKKCTPMLDSMTSGYLLSLWSDVIIDEDDGVPININWQVSEDVFSVHGLSSREIPTPPGYDKIVFKYNSLLTITTPPGYSTLVLPPMGYQDLAFRAIPAIIDTDKPTIDLQFPVWVKSEFKGVVEKGTPMVQIIPFKRESWVSEFDYMTKKDFDIYMDNNFNSVIKNHYIKNIWSKKDYR